MTLAVLSSHIYGISQIHFHSLPSATIIPLIYTLIYTNHQNIVNHACKDIQCSRDRT